MTSNPVHNSGLETRAWLYLKSVSSIWNSHYCSKSTSNQLSPYAKGPSFGNLIKCKCRVPHTIQIIPIASPALGSDGDALEMRVVLSSAGVHWYCFIFCILYCSSDLKFLVPSAGTQPRESSALCFPACSCPSLTLLHPTKLFKEPSWGQECSASCISAHLRLHSHFQIKRERKRTYFQSRNENPWETTWSTGEALCPPASHAGAPPLPGSPASSSTRSARQPKNSLYLGTVLTLVVLPAVVWHLVTYQVGLPVESFGALVTLVLPLLTVWQHVLLQAVETGAGLSEMGVYGRREQSTQLQPKERKLKSPKGPALTEISPVSSRLTPARRQNLLLPTRITHPLMFCQATCKCSRRCCCHRSPRRLFHTPLTISLW